MADVCTLEDVQVDQDNTNYTYTGTYRLKLTTPTSDAVVALVAGRAAAPNPIPVRFAAYPSDDSAFAQRFRGKRLRDDNQANEYWEFTVIWSPLPPGSKSGDSASTPTARPTHLRLEYQETQEELREAYNVDALTSRAAGTYGTIVNGALQTPPNKIYVPKRSPILVATKNFATQDAVDTLNRTFENTVNNATFYGRAAHYAKFLSADVTEEIRENTFVYYQATIRVALGFSPWYYEIDNVGFQFWTGAACTGQLLNAFDDQGQPVAEPVKLELDGRERAKNATLLKIRYRPNEVDYSTIGIGTAW